ncbi:lamin-B receptor [Anopheles ziemanni]|uniref:lamin-B receptor n=1 Tax=Anopheles coustani TaxID=139045 RepID=UPI00265AFCCB|nr:lamin-B receptor [Anopheles coustani]XP_058171354.1 lamin-B receptor [Anopheles ziemanni]
MEGRGRGKRLSTVVTAPASSSTAAKEAPAAAAVVEKKKPGRKPLAATARKRSPSPVAPKRRQSPARKASPARRASPARKASPARRASPARKASPSRKPKTTTNAAPAAKAVETVKASPEEPRRSERIRASEEKVDQVLSSMTKKNPVDKRLSVILDDMEVSGYMTGEKQSSPAKSLTPNTSRRSNAITPTTTERSRATLSRSLSVVLDDYSDQEEDDGDFQSFRRTADNNGVGDGKSFAQQSVPKMVVKQRLVEFGGPLGAAALVVLIPLFIFTNNHFCSGAVHRDCRFVLPKNWDEFRTLSTYMNREIGMLYGLFVAGVALLTALPIGKQVKLANDTYTKRTHIFNGLLVAMLTGLGVFVAEYCYKYPLLSVVSRGYNQLLVLSLLTALVGALFSFLMSRSVDDEHLNPYAKTGNVLYDYFAGRDTHPVVMNVFNLKLVTYHVAVVLALLFNSIILYRNLHFATLPETLLEAPVHERLLFAVKNLTCETVPVAAAGLTVLYLLDLLAYEHHLAASFELQAQGFGAEMLLRYAVFPFALTQLPKYVAAHKFTDVPLWAVLGCVVVALVGLYVKRSSMRLKYLYRLDPLGELACLETYPTYQGRRLLVAKLWRFVRQPNYLGDILQNLALLPLLYWRFAWPPLLSVLFIVSILVHRAKRLTERNARKYDTTWHRYCLTVPRMIVPRVY